MRSILLAITSAAAIVQGQAMPGGAVPATVRAPSTAGFRNATVQPSRGGLAVCVSGFVNVTASTSKNVRFNFPIPANQTSTTDAFVKYITAGSSYPMMIMNGTQNVSGVYEIGATLCTPATNTSVRSIHLLTHGIGFDRYYWDFAPGYSYVDIAAASGYATLSYDRLGVGKSQKADPMNELQGGLESEIAAGLARLLRNGTFANTTYSRVIGVGHSFGSVISQAVTNNYPTLLDAAILTGFSLNATALPAFILGLNFRIAREQDPIRFANLPLGYLASSSSVSDQIGFFTAPNFDPLVLAAATTNKGSTSYAELFSISAFTAPAKNFTGAVAVVNGNGDLPFCFGNCSYPMDLAAAVAPALYPAVSKNRTGTYLAPGTGHGLGLHYTATAAYQWVQTFLMQQGL